MRSTGHTDPAAPVWDSARRCHATASRVAAVGLAAFLALALSGCGAGTTPSSTLSATPTVTATALATATVSPTVTPTPTPTQLKPTPTPTPAPKPLSFVATGSMHTARSAATATLLKNGKVLIAGGGYNVGAVDSIYASAEIYDQTAGKFTKTGSRTAARIDATAVLLGNGKVLIAGGEGCSDPKHCGSVPADSNVHLASAELYDPTSGKFTPTGSMAETRVGAPAALLPDGLVLIAGDSEWAELYNPDSGRFTRTGKETGPDNGTATLLPDGKVLVTGDSFGDTVAQLYDESSGKFTTISLTLPAGTPLVQHKGLDVPRTAPDTATLLPDGRVLLFEGGYLETYDPKSGVCADGGFISPAAQWIGPTATLLPDGRVPFEGGVVYPQATVESTGELTKTAVLYDPTGGPFRTGTTRVSCGYETATLLSGGSVLIAGGLDADYNLLSSAELFKP